MNQMRVLLGLVAFTVSENAEKGHPCISLFRTILVPPAQQQPSDDWCFARRWTSSNRACPGPKSYDVNRIAAPSEQLILLQKAFQSFTSITLQPTNHQFLL